MKMKRLFTLVLSLMMILSLSAPASAIDGENVYTKEEISSINEVNVATCSARRWRHTTPGRKRQETRSRTTTSISGRASRRSCSMRPSSRSAT